MIPHRLQIKNFLSYGADMQTVDFNPHHLIYLSGKNGHGKSALLDAMTWAIWGVARKTLNAVKADQGLLRLGATQMVVIFDFELDSQMYRVKREFIQAAGGKPLAYLEFGMVNIDGSIVALTDKTIRATQAVIEKTIRLDYESFINSAFLRQGHANEFSQKSPKDRKEILGTILGLQQFELVKRRALERVKESGSERQALMAVQDSMTQQLKMEQDLGHAMQLLAQDIAAIKKEDLVLINDKKNIQEKREQLALKQAAYEQLSYKITQHETIYTEQMLSYREIFSMWRTVHAQQLRLPDIKTIEQQRTVLNGHIAGYQKAMQERLVVHAQLLQLTDSVQRRQRDIEASSQSALQQMVLSVERLRFEKELQNKLLGEHAGALEQLTQQHALMTTDLAVLQKASISVQDLSVQQALYEKRKDCYHSLIARGNWLKAELDALIAKKDVAHNDNPSCPLCEQNLSAARRKFLGSRVIKQEKLIIHQIARIARIVAKLKDMIVAQHAALEQHKKQQQEIITKQKDLERITAELTAATVRGQELSNALAKIVQEAEKQAGVLAQKEQDAKNSLANDVQYQQLTQEHAAVAKLFQQLVYDERAHQKAQQDLQVIEKQIALSGQLREQVAQQTTRQQEIAKLSVQLKQKKAQRALFEKEKLQFKELQSQLQEQSEQEKLFEQKLRTIQQRKEKAREQHGRIKSRQEMEARLKEEQKKQQEMIEKLNKEIEDYQLIANAAGKDGIQALLIEEAIPEIEQEANALLSRLTNNQSQIFIESLRDLKRGGSKETLDINIADPSGIRPYEMFSGGEAFRIDFALRIAISKLLARRAGTALQTLIIDEGFGSQDEDGLSLIMDAIYKIQEDFERVIIVSHLPGMKDQFPVHFVVRKGPNGSAVSIIEQA